jgi:hypothetical protein
MKEKEPEIKIDPVKLKPKFIELHQKICAIINPILEETKESELQSQIELIFVIFTVFCKMAGMSGESLYQFSNLNEIGQTNLDEEVFKIYAKLGKEIFGVDFDEKSPPHSQS